MLLDADKSVLRVIDVRERLAPAIAEPDQAMADVGISRDPANKAAALEGLAANGVEIVTSEMVVFECLRAAGSDVFREFSKLIK